MNIHAPWILFQHRKKFLPWPWLTPETKELMRLRDNWRKKAKDLEVDTPGVVSGNNRMPGISSSCTEIKVITRKIMMRLLT